VERYLLSIVVLVPAATALVVFVVGRAGRVLNGRDGLLRALICGATAVSFAASLPLWFTFEVRGAEWQFTERLDILPSIGASYALGVDGLSALLVLLTTLVFLIAVLARTPRGRECYIAALLLESGLLGVYMALDLLLFWLAWMVAAASMCFLIGAAGGRTRLAVRIGVITLVPGVVILLGVLLIYVQGQAITGAGTFDMRVFRQLALPPHVQRWVFVAFFLGCGGGLFGVFRWWLTVASDARAFAVPVLLSALFLKMGTYAFLRLTLPLLPDASRSFAPAVIGLAAMGILLSAVAAFAQTNWNRVLAYASLGHLCLVTLGAFALTPDGLTGSAVHQINHGLSIAALFLLAGLVVERGSQGGIGGGAAVGMFDRRGETQEAIKIGEYGGLLNAMPLVAAVWLIVTLSLVGVPKLNGYVGTRLAFEGLWPISRPWSIVAAGGMILSGVALLWLFSRTMLGELKTPGGYGLKDLRLREALAILPLVLLAVWIGLSPAQLLARVETSVARVVLRVSPEYAPEVVDCLTQPPPSPAETGLPAGIVVAAPCADGATSPTPPKP
jgi:NADH-quinone oxidoreductase subunit M